MTRSVQKLMLFGVAGVLLLGQASSVHAQECDPVEIAKFLADDGAVLDFFGHSVAIDGDTAVVGAIRDADNGHFSGSAYVFTKSEGVWAQQAKLLPSDGVAGDQFGWSVSVDGDTAVVGAAWADQHGNASGSAYVFTRSGEAWTQQAKLLPADGDVDDRFGVSVSIDGDTVLIGADRDDYNGRFGGSAYIFTRSGGVWTEQAKLLPADGEAGRQFGYFVSVSGDTSVITAVGGNDNGTFSGSAYVFTRSGGVWTELTKLLPADGAAGDRFGISASLGGDTAVIGADQDDDNGSDSGSAYVFAQSGGVWTEQIKLLPSDGEEIDQFGKSVSLSGDTAVIGAWEDDDNGSFSGSAYVFTRSGGEWAERAKLMPADGAEADRFGFSVSISDDTAAIGAYFAENDGARSGSAYVFDLNCTDCPADLNGDGVVNTQDFLAFLGAWSAGDPTADWNGDGDINTLDFLAYLADWSAGCP